MSIIPFLLFSTAVLSNCVLLSIDNVISCAFEKFNSQLTKSTLLFSQLFQSRERIPDCSCTVCLHSAFKHCSCFNEMARTIANCFSHIFYYYITVAFTHDMRSSLRRILCANLCTTFTVVYVPYHQARARVCRYHEDPEVLKRTKSYSEKPEIRASSSSDRSPSSIWPLMSQVGKPRTPAALQESASLLVASGKHST